MSTSPAFGYAKLSLMYPKPRFLEELHAIREEMARECDYDLDLFAQMVRSGQSPDYGPVRNRRGRRVRAPKLELPKPKKK